MTRPSRRPRSSASTSSALKRWPAEDAARSLRPELAKALRKLEYTVTRQNGAHLRATTPQGGEHHEVVPNHSPVKLGTLKSILRSVAHHHRMSVAELMAALGW